MAKGKSWKWWARAMALPLVALLAEASTITTISPSTGGILGGTRLTILGTGFDERGRSNDVYVGDERHGVFCDPVPNECHSKRIVCLTGSAERVAALRGQQTLSVRTHGALARCDARADCQFTYTDAAVPWVQSVSPEWVAGSTRLTFGGRHFAQGDATVANFDLSFWIGDEERCEIAPGSVSSSSATCTAVALPFAGWRKLRVQMGSRGNARAAPNAQGILVVPTIDGVSVARGSMAGGQRLTVYGTAFSKNPADVKVTVHGVPCTVLQTTEEFVVCVTGAHAATAPADVRRWPGQALVEAWSVGQDIDSIQQLHDSLRYVAPTEVKRVGEFGGSSHFPGNKAMRATTLFVPMKGGEYVFELIAEGNAELWLSTDDTPVRRVKTAVTDADETYNARIARVRIAVADFDRFASQRSAPQKLAAGKKYWLRYLTLAGGVKTGARVKVLRLTGDGGNVTVTTPHHLLPANLFEYQEEWRSPVSVESDGVAAMMGDACVARGSCDFHYTADVTAELISTSLSVRQLTVHGKGFREPAEWMVSVAGVACPLSPGSSSTQLKCDIGAVSPGVHPISVSHFRFGRAAGTATVEISLDVSSLHAVDGIVKMKLLGVPLNDEMNVTINNQPCELTKVSTDEIQCAAPVDMASTAAAAVSVKSKAIVSATAPAAFVSTDQFLRPGTTSEVPPPSFSPRRIPAGGGTDLQIIIPGVNTADATVTIGGAKCEIKATFGPVLFCRTAAALPGTKPVVAKIAGVEYAVGNLVMVGGLVSSWPAKLSPLGASSVRLHLREPLPYLQPEDVEVSIAGVPCPIRGLHRTRIICDAAPRLSPLSGVVKLDLAATGQGIPTSVLASKTVSVVGSAFSISEVGGYVFSRRRLVGPFALEAEVVAHSGADGSVVSLVAGAVDPTSTDSGVHLRITLSGPKLRVSLSGSAIGFMSVEQGADRMKGQKIKIGKPVKLRLEILSGEVRGFLNGVLLWSRRAGVATEMVGIVGFSSSRAAELRSLRGFSVDEEGIRVTLRGSPLPNNGVSVIFYSTDELHTVRDITPREIAPGDTLTVSSHSGLAGNIGQADVWIAAKKAKPSVTSEWTGVCQPGSHRYSTSTGFRCVVASIIRPGSFDAKFNPHYGFTKETFSLTVKSSVVSVQPSVMSLGGGLVTISGGALPSLPVGNDNAITFSGSKCRVVAAGATRILCRISPRTDIAVAAKPQLSFTAVVSDGAQMSFTDAGPIVASVTPPKLTSTDDVLLIKGSGLGEALVTVGGEPCKVIRAKSDSLQCRLTPSLTDSATDSLPKAVIVDVIGAGVARGVHDVTLIGGVAAVSSFEGAPGAILTLKGLGFAMPKSQSTLSSTTFDKALGGWSVSERMSPKTPFRTVAGVGAVIGGWGQFGMRTTVHRVFDGVLKGVLVLKLKLVAFDFWWDDAFVVTVDDKTFHFRSEHMFDGSRNANDGLAKEIVGVFDSWLAVPTSGGTVSVSVGVDTAVFRSWAVSHISVKSASQFHQSVELGKTSRILMVSPTEVRFAVPGGATGSNVIVIRENGKLMPCNSCKFTVKTSTAVNSVHSLGIHAADRITWARLTANSHVSRGADVISTKDADWNEGAMSKEVYLRGAMDAFSGVEFAVGPGAAVGIIVGHRRSFLHRGSIDFGIRRTIDEGNDFEVVENGNSQWQVRTVAAASADSDALHGAQRASVRISTAGQVEYWVDGLLVYRSLRTIPTGSAIRIAVVLCRAGAAATNVVPLFIGGAKPSHHLFAVSGSAVVANSDVVATVALGGEECIVSAVSEGRLLCSAPPVAEDSPVALELHSAYGDVSASFKLSRYAVVAGIHPTTGGASGGLPLTITGANFPDASKCRVTIGGVDCVIDVKSSSSTTLICIAPLLSTSAAHSVVVELQDGTSVPCVGSWLATPVSNCPVYVTSDKLDVSISAAPSSINEGALVTIKGAGFAAAASLISVSIGAGYCDVSSISDSTVECVAHNLVGSSTKQRLTLLVFNRAAASVATTVPLLITSPKFKMGTGGGASVMIQGVGFGPAGSSAELKGVKEGKTACTSLVVVSASQMRCVVAAGSFAELELSVNGGAAVSVGYPFSGSDVHSAMVSSASPEAVGRGELLTITGLNLDDPAEIRLGAVSCDLVSATSKQVTCRVNGNIVDGSDVWLVSRSRGVATGSAQVDGRFGFAGVTPAIAKAGDIITLHASRLEADSRVKVLIGGTQCDNVVMRVATQTVSCVVPVGLPAGQPLDVQLRLEAGVLTFSSTLNYNKPVRPTISTTSPVKGTAAGGYLITITGNNFSPQETQNTVMINDGYCNVLSARDDEILCTAPRLSTPSPDATIVVSVGHRRSNTIAFSADLHILGVGSSKMTAGGGTPLTVTGRGFGTNTSWVDISVDGADCPVVSVVDHAAVCTLPPAPWQIADAKRPTLQRTFDKNVKKSAALSLRVKGIEATGTASIPISSAVNAITSVFVSGSDDMLWTGKKVTIAGNFKNPSTLTVRLVNTATPTVSSSCTVTSHSTSQIVCNPTVETFGPHMVRVWSKDQGALTQEIECPLGKFLTCDGECLADADCLYAAWGIDGAAGSCQQLADLVNGEGFCHSNGGSDRVSQPFALDSGKSMNLNCPMYNCEGGDCNAKLEIGGHGAVVSSCGLDPTSTRFRLVPTVTGVSAPNGGMTSIGGGARFTIIGTSLSLGDYTSVVIGETLCTPLTLSDDRASMVCETGPTQTPTNKKQTLILSRAGVVAKCDPSVCGGFKFVETATPVVSTFYPIVSRAGLARCVAGETVTVHGSGFGSSAATVSVGQKSVSVDSQTKSQLVFTCPRHVAGTTPIQIRFESLGSPLMPDDAAVEYSPTIMSLSVTEASREGGAVMTITGSAFGPDTTFVFKSGTPLVIKRGTAITPTSAIVVLPASAGGKRLVVARDPLSRTSFCGAEGKPATCDVHVAGRFTFPVNSVTLTGATVTIEADFRGLSATDIDVTVGPGLCARTDLTQTQYTCTVPAGATMPAGEFPIILTRKPWGFASMPVKAPTVSYALNVSAVTPASGGRGGGQPITIMGNGFGKDPERVSVAIAGVPCDILQVTQTEIKCERRPSDAASGPVQVTMSASAAATAASGPSFDVTEALTPVISSFHPQQGSTAGGTVLTFAGNNLLQDGVAPTVTVGGLECTVDLTETSASTLVCSTAAVGKTVEGAEVVVQSTSGLAVGDDLKYDYVDLWSRWSTWGGTPPPLVGDSAIVRPGQTVSLDVSPPRLNLIIVMGHLRVQDTSDLLLESTYIMINHGRFTLGTPNKPFMHKATLRFFGDRLTPEIPVHGAKVLALRHGALDLHGKPRKKTWTLLAATAKEGAGHIVVAGPIDWQEGEEIVVASTDFKMEHAEKRIITQVVDSSKAKATVFFADVLKHSHYGKEQCFAGTCISEMAEVILLSRNVVIEGDADTQRLGFGATMFLMPMGERNDRYARLSFIELRDVGQQYIVGRYPVHFHVTHGAKTSYVNGTSVHRSLNRAYSIHGVNHNTYVNNVVYDTHGHSFFIEDGSERHNVIEDNVVIMSRSSTSNLNTDITPANFWIVSPANSIRRNRAAGSMAYGFWIAPFHPHATGPTHSTSICPSTQQLWRFDDNVAHSNGKYGLNIFQYWWPKTTECDMRSPDAPAVLRNLVTWKNKIHGVTSAHSMQGQIGAVTWDGLVSADNGENHPDASAFWTEKVRASNMSFGITNSALIATTDNSPYSRSHLLGATKNRRGINLPLGDNFFAENVTFVNYKGDNYAMEPQAWAERGSFCFPWGWEAVTKGLKFVKSPNRALFRFAHHGIISDVDGSLTDKAGGQLVPAAPIFDPKKCSKFAHTTKHSALVCTGDRVHRFGVSSVSDVKRDQLWTVDGREEIINSIKGQYSVTAPVGQEVFIDFNGAKVPDQWSWRMDNRFAQSEDRTLFRVNYKSRIPIVEASFDGADPHPATGPPTKDQDSNSTFHYNRATGDFTGLLAHPSHNMEVTGAACNADGCPSKPAAPPRVVRPCTAFDAPISWMTGEVPRADAVLHVQYNDSICLDRAVGSYSFASLLLEGTLELSDAHCPAGGGPVVFNIRQHIHIRGGALLVGVGAKLTMCSVEFRVAEPDYSGPTAGHYLHPWGMRAIVLENGLLDIHGSSPASPFVRLAADAMAGAAMIVVDGSTVGWRVGDRIAVAGTNRLPYQTRSTARSHIAGLDQTEEHLIKAISATSITLERPLVYSHTGGKRQLGETTYSIGAEVSHLTRRVTFSGGSRAHKEWGVVLALGCTPSVLSGCGGAGNGSAMSMLKTGDVRIDGVAFEDFGQAGSRRSAVEIDGVVSTADYRTAAGSFISNCVFTHTLNTVLSVRSTTRNFRLTGNVIYRYRGDAVRVGGSSNEIEGNLALEGNAATPTCTFTYLDTGGGMDCLGGAYRVATGNLLKGNVAAGGAMAGFAIEGEPCDSPALIEGNVAHGMRDGVLVRDVNHEPDYIWTATSWTGKCRKVSGFLTHGISDIGVAAWSVEGNLVVEKVVVVDATIGLSPVLFSASTADDVVPEFTLRDSSFAGRWPGQSCDGSLRFTCRESKVNTLPWCQTLISRHPIHSVGVMGAAFHTGEYSGRTLGQHFYMWNEVDSYSPAEARATIERVHFDNFVGAEQGGSCSGLHSVAFHQNPFSNDTFHKHTFSGVSWGSAMTPEGRLLTHRTYGDIPGHKTLGVQSTWLDFDNPKHGATWPDAPNNLWIVDKDGSFSDSTGQTHIVSSETMVRASTFAAIGFDGKALRTPAALGPVRSDCTDEPTWGAFKCAGDQQLFTLVVEHLGEDKLTRRASPVVLCKGDGTFDERGEPKCQGGNVQFSSGPVTKGRRQMVTLERLPRFWFRAEQGGNYTLFFRGQPPSDMRLRVLDDDYLGLPEAAGITVNIRYFGINAHSRVAVFVDGKRAPLNVFFSAPWEAKPKAMVWPAPRAAAGTNFFNKATVDGVQVNVLSVTIRSRSVLELRQEPIVAVSLGVGIPLSEFFDNLDTFAAAMASALGIPPSRMRFVDIVAGSRRRAGGNAVELKIEVDAAPGIMDEVSMDAGTSDSTVAATKELGGVNSRMADLTHVDIDGEAHPLTDVVSNLIPVMRVQPPVRVAEGISYLLVLARAPEGSAFSDMAVADHAAARIRVMRPKAPLLRDTAETDVFVSNVWTNSTLAPTKRPLTEFTMTVSYFAGSRADTLAAVQALVSDHDLMLPDGYELVSVQQFLVFPSVDAPGSDFGAVLGAAFAVGFAAVLLVALVGGLVWYFFCRRRAIGDAEGGAAREARKYQVPTESNATPPLVIGE